MKKILGVSLIAMMAVTTVRAEIASKAYVDSGAGTVISASNTAGQNIKALDTALGALPANSNVMAEISSAISGAAGDYAPSDVLDDLDATESQTAGTDGLALEVTQVDGLITGISGSIAAETYEPYGAVAAAMNGTNGTLVKHTANTAAGSGTNPVYIAADGTATASAATVGSATQPVYLSNGTFTAGNQLGTAAEATLETSAVTANGTTVPTTGQVATYVANQIAAQTNAETGTLVQHTAGQAAGSGTNPVYIAADGTATASAATVGSATQPVYLSNGTFTAGNQLGTAAEATVETTGVASNTTTLPTTAQVKSYVDAAGSSVKSVQVNSTGLTPDANGAVNVTVATGSTAGTVAVNGSDVAVAVPTFNNSTAGEYVLTASVDASGNPTYHWELISRTGSETDESVRAAN